LTPEGLATALGFEVRRLLSPPLVAGVTVISEFQPEHTIVLYRSALIELANKRKEPLPRLEQWHIAHELYHGLAEEAGTSAWRVRETEADMWADELLTLATG